jgi:hypothetical protein
MATPLNGTSILVLVRTVGTAFTNEAFGTGTGSQVTFTHTMAHIPVMISTVSITAGAVTATDDGTGNLIGTGVSGGSINYDTGVATITYTTAPANSQAITANYSTAVYTAVGYQRTATFDEKTAAIDVSNKSARQAQYIPGQYTATLNFTNLYVPSDTAYSMLKTAMRTGNQIVVARQESNVEVEHAFAVITDISGSFNDQAAAVITMSASISGPWVAP